MSKQAKGKISFFTAARLFARFAVEESARMDARYATDPAPTPAQRKSGKYAKGTFVWNGLTIAIENPVGSLREGVTPQGIPWRTRMTCDYGYFTQYGGADGDELDVLIGPDLTRESVFVVDQKTPGTGDFDEAKVVIGCADIAEAHALYLSNYQEGWEVNIRNITPMTLDGFKKWLEDGEGAEARSMFHVDFTKVELGSFTGADFSAGDFVTVPALLSRAGHYADKGIELTRQDFDRAARYVSPTSAVPMNMAHLRRGTVLDDAGLGQIERTWRRGDELWGEIAVPKWLASLARERGLKLPVSAEWDIKTKTLKGCAWERTPRIEDAKAQLT